MRFENRETTNSNRKNLQVLEVNYNPNTGELANLEVEETSNEGTVTQEGTKLNADNLNNAFEDFNRNKFLHFYFKEVYGIVINEDDYTIELNGTTSKTINITYDNISPLYPSLTDTYNPNFNIVINRNNIPHTITITRNDSLSVSDSGRIKISVFVSGSENTKVCELNFKYTYTPSSTNPLD